jgi:hypothetical protein
MKSKTRSFIFLALIAIISLIALAPFTFAYEQVFYIYDNQDLDARYDNYFYNSNQRSYVYIINQNQFQEGYKEGYDDAYHKYYGNPENPDYNDNRYVSDTPFRYTYEVKSQVYGTSYSRPKELSSRKTYISDTYATSSYRYYPGARFPQGYFERISSN